MDDIITLPLQADLIESVANLIEQRHGSQGTPYERISVVFGGRRPSLFLQRALAKRIKKAYRPPLCYSMDDFIRHAASSQQQFGSLQDLDACYFLYQKVRELDQSILGQEKTFARFLPWAREIYSFIEQLDLEDIQSEALVQVEKSAQIGYEIPESINVLLRHIVVLRQQLHQYMQSSARFARGFTYLHSARTIDRFLLDETDVVLFCGLFYLHKTEELVIKNLRNRGKAILIFQGDAGQWDVLHRAEEAFSCRIRVPAFDAAVSNVHLYAGFDAHSQAGIVRDIVNQLQHPEKTVVVVPDPSAVTVLLPELVQQERPLNVSLGYPLQRSSLYSLVQAVIRAQLGRKGTMYYVKDYLHLLRHPLVKNIRILTSHDLTRVAVHKTEDVLTGAYDSTVAGSLFLELSELEHLSALGALVYETATAMGYTSSRDDAGAILSFIHDIFFRAWEGVGTLSHCASALDKLINVLLDQGTLSLYPVNLNTAQRMLDICDSFFLADCSREIFPCEDIFAILEQNVENEKVAFLGSPLKGLQVLGLLETRALHFDTVIVMDANESVLPKLKIFEPLISREVMINLGLNRLEKEEEIQRYQFMRLISGAQQVHVVYSHAEDKEKSRFVEELIWQRQKNTGVLQPFTIPKAQFTTSFLPTSLAIKKSSRMIEFLRSIRYSASSINTYMQCPLQFYYTYVLNLRPKEVFIEEPDTADIGIFVHALLKEVFSRFIGEKPLFNKAFRKYFFECFDQRFDEYFSRRMKGDSFLIKEVLKVRLSDFLNFEDQSPDRKVKEIKYLEAPFNQRLSLPIGDFECTYTVDRVDVLEDGSILIIDYKTGSVGNLPEKLERLRSLELSRESLLRCIRSFQLPLYYYFEKQKFINDNVDACLYSIKQLGIKRLFSNGDDEYKKEVIDICFKALDFLLRELLDPTVPFSPSPDESRCRMCAYFYLCR